jgi:hypothetical protein
MGTYLQWRPTGIFLWLPWGLYEAIKGDEFKHIDFSHDCVPFEFLSDIARRGRIADSVTTAAQLLPFGVVRQLISRTSTGARQATTALRPHASASSRSAAFSTQKPPMCSLLSRYGPSVMST